MTDIEGLRHQTTPPDSPPEDKILPAHDVMVADEVAEEEDLKARHHTNEIIPDKIHSERLRRQLKSRHGSMIALGGAIGTGLILTSGVGLARAGPVGLLLAFMYVGSLCYGMMQALGEMSAFLPHQRGFAGHGSRFVSEGWGGMTGVTYYCKYLISTGTSWAGGATILDYWLPPSRVSNAVWISVFLVIALVVQFMPVRYFGEFEFWMCTAKITVLLGLMIFAIVIDLGGGPSHDRWGFRTWRDYPFGEYLVSGSVGKLYGFLAALVTAVYSYTGTEMIGVALGEMKSPRRNVSRALRAAFYRITILYCGSIFLIGLIVPANSPLLLTANKHSANANASPFVVAINVAGIKVLPHIVNACMLLFILSGSNSDIYINSRTLYALAADGHAPKIFARVNRFGTPYVCLSISLAFACLGYTTASASALTVFKYFVSAVTLFSTTAWISITFSHLRFMKACKVQGLPRNQLPYRSPLQPYLSWYTLIGTSIVSILKGFDSIAVHFDAKGFVVAYVALPVAIVSYLAYAIRYRSWLRAPEEIDLVTETRLDHSGNNAIQDDDDEPERKRGIITAIKVFWAD